MLIFLLGLEKAGVDFVAADMPNAKTRLCTTRAGSRRSGNTRAKLSAKRDAARPSPEALSSPGDLIGYQRRVDEIATRLRFQFNLRE